MLDALKVANIMPRSPIPYDRLPAVGVCLIFYFIRSAANKVTYQVFAKRERIA